MTPMQRADVHAKARAEAIRVVPGILAAQERGDVGDAAKLLSTYHDTAVELGCSCSMAWSVLFSATIHWCAELARRVARNEDVEPRDVFLKMAAMAALWVSDREGVGGY